jgi:uncharacterized membrane protein
MKSRVFEVISAGLFVAAWLLAAQAIPTLPPRIATHFDIKGVADGFGPAASLSELPVIATALYAIMSSAQFMPARWMNYPVKVTDRNRAAVFALGREMLPAIKVCAMLTLVGTEWGTIDGAVRGTIGPPFVTAIFAPIVILVGIIVYYTIKMRAV